MTVTVFAAGLIAGRLAGSLTGALSFLLHSVLNPFGLAIPTVLAAQVILGGLAGLTGGMCRKVGDHGIPSAGKAGVFAVVGALLTLIYDLGTTVAFGLSATAESLGVLALIVAGLPFTGIHVASNAGTFAIVASAVSRHRFAVAAFLVASVLCIPGHAAAEGDFVSPDSLADSLQAMPEEEEPDTLEVAFWQGPYLDSSEVGWSDEKLGWAGAYGSRSIGERVSLFSNVAPGLFGAVHSVLSSYFGFPLDVCLDGRVVREEQVPYLALIDGWRKTRLSDLLYSSGFELGRIETMNILNSLAGEIVDGAGFSSGRSVLAATWVGRMDPPYSQFLLTQGSDRFSVTHFRFGRSLPYQSWVTLRAAWTDEGEFREELSAARSGFSAAAGASLTESWQLALLAKRSESDGNVNSIHENSLQTHHYEELRKDIDLVLAGKGGDVFGEVRVFHGDYQSLLEESGSNETSQWRQIYGVQGRIGYVLGAMVAEAGGMNSTKHGLEGFETGWWNEQNWYLRTRYSIGSNRFTGLLRSTDRLPEEISGAISFSRNLTATSSSQLTLERLVWSPDRSVEEYGDLIGLEFGRWEVLRASGTYELRGEAFKLRALQSFSFHRDKPESPDHLRGWGTGITVEALPWRFFRFWGLVQARGGEEEALLSYEHRLRSSACGVFTYELPREIKAELYLRWDNWVRDEDRDDMTGTGLVISAEGVSLSLEGRNLLDEQVEWIPGFPLEGRQFTLSLDWHFTD
jgi:hypothetical protein